MSTASIRHITSAAHGGCEPDFLGDRAVAPGLLRRMVFWLAGNPEGGHSVAWEPPDPEEEMRLEIFSLPYLFKGPRPMIGAVVTEWNYGAQVSLPTPQAAIIRWAHLIKGDVTTHSFDCEQRLVDLPIVTRNTTSLGIAVPGNRNLAPPGWYMLFIVDTNGVLP